MNKKNLFKLYKYCVNFYCHKYHKDIYLTDEEWIDIFSSKKQYNKFLHNIKKKDIFVSSTNYVDDCFFLSINYDINRFKRILKLLQKKDILYEFDIVEYIIDLPVTFLTNQCDMNENDLLKLVKSNEQHLYIYEQVRIILNKYDYNAAYFYYGKFIKAYIDYLQNFKLCDRIINELYHKFFTLRIDYKQYKLYNDILACTFNDLFIKMLNDNIVSTNTLISFAENLNMFFSIKVNNQCVNKIYNHIYNHYINKALTPYNIYFTLVSMSKLYELLDFTKEQKKVLNDFIIKVKAQHLLAQL